MSIVKNSGLKQAAIATERGWETPDGKLVISSRNLLTNRVLQNFATPEEIKRWSESQLNEINHRKHALLTTLETNETRLKTISDQFEAAHAHLANDENTKAQIEYLQKKIEHLKLVGEYEKSFANTKVELERLNSKEEKIQARLNTILTVVPSLTEQKSENKPDSAESNKKNQQEDKTDKSVQAKEVEVLPEKKKRRFGPKPGWKKRKAEEEARKKAAEAERLRNEETVAVPGYPVPEGEILPD